MKNRIENRYMSKSVGFFMSSRIMFQDLHDGFFNLTVLLCFIIYKAT